MQVFEYRISVIVPVYNAEEYLRDCLNSLLKQTISQNEIEVLMINDGSNDNSEEICREYAEIYDNFKLYSKENEGLSATRNFGLSKANGKYICYLDADDTFSDETLKNICDFFDCHYDEIDEVTYPIVRYKNGKTLPLHYRYKYLNKTGIYDLESYPYISQTTINLCVKNKKEKNILFDTTPNFRHEDQKYNNMNLLPKMKIGFVKEAEYKYNRDNEGSIVSTYMYPYYIFETTMNYYEKLFSLFEEKVPSYYQALFIHDLNWKLCDDKLFPFHYDTNQFTHAVNRIKDLLAKCDASTIIEHPTMNIFHIQYWLQMKPNVFPTVISQPGRYDIWVQNKSIYNRNYFEIIMHKVRVNNGKLRMLGFIKSPIYNHLKDPCELYVVENNRDRKKMDTFISIHSYFRCQFTQTNNFYAFDYICDVNQVKEFYFEVVLNDICYPTKYWCMPTAVFDLKNGINKYVREQTLITLDNNIIRLNQVSNNEIDTLEHEMNLKYKKDFTIYNLRESSLRYRKKHKIWLYYDAYTVKKDNAYYQFLNDFKHSQNDYIERYYISFSAENMDLFDEEQRKYVVPFGSDKHKLLYLSCEKVFTAFFGFTPISPFLTEQEEAKYSEIIKFETIYLQHGVLHAALRTYNAVERCRAEKIVVSSQFEIDNYMNNYHYRREELVPTGMARYDFIDRTKKPKNRILYAPSWRKYLTFSKNASDWTVVKDKLIESDYFLNMERFLNDKELENILERENLILDVKLHPIISKDAHNLFEFKTNRIQVVDEVQIEDYKMFITDFSSFVFDFACLNRPILYFVTDYLQFKSGMNHYKSLDLDFNDAFGTLSTTVEEVINELRKVVDNNFVSQEPYKSRMKEFYVPLDNCRERLYQYIMKEDKERDIFNGKII